MAISREERQKGYDDFSKNYSFMNPTPNKEGAEAFSPLLSDVRRIFEKSDEKSIRNFQEVFSSKDVLKVLRELMAHEYLEARRKIKEGLNGEKRKTSVTRSVSHGHLVDFCYSLFEEATKNPDYVNGIFNEISQEGKEIIPLVTQTRVVKGEYNPYTQSSEQKTNALRLYFSWAHQIRDTDDVAKYLNKVGEDLRALRGESVQKTNLETKVTGIITIAGLVAGIFFLLSFFQTSNVLASPGSSINWKLWTGISLLLIGLVAGFFYFKRKK